MSRRHSYHTVAATHWSDSDHTSYGGPYPPLASHGQVSPQYSNAHGQDGALNGAAYRALYPGVSPQYTTQPNEAPTSNYLPYAPVTSAVVTSSNGGYHERRNQTLPLTDAYDTHVGQSALPSSYPPHNAPALHSQSRWHTQPYNATTHPPLPVAQSLALYPAHPPSSQGMNAGSQHPASPPRPYACDMCPLSFNRQHDLKRHRETHSGEKPYLCNGGCGKTFTRKDALKRHQLVKSCGKPEEAWS